MTNKANDNSSLIKKLLYTITGTIIAGAVLTGSAQIWATVTYPAKINANKEVITSVKETNEKLVKSLQEIVLKLSSVVANQGHQNELSEDRNDMMIRHYDRLNEHLSDREAHGGG